MALALKWLHGIPFLCYVHGEDVNSASTSRELAWLTRRVFRGAACIIANSRNTRQILLDEWGLAPERIALLNPGVDTERFVPAERSLAVRQSLGWGERPVVLTVGRLQKRKGQDQMIRALCEVRQSLPDVLYAIVGYGEELASLHQLVLQEGVEAHVQFLGEVADDELIQCYQQCDLFALPNRQVGRDIEGFGMVLVEAQACGKPVLAGASGGTAETLQDPATGRVVDCEDPHRLAEVVIELLQDPELRASMGAAGRPWVVEHFDWAALSRQAQAIFRHGPSACAFAPLCEPAST
jgi:phosphatidylinositol alpha-1,6-mannosyltransferase